MKLKPIADRVLIRRDQAPGATKGGILLPDVAKEKPTRAEVLAVGPGRLLADGTRGAMQVKPGDVVLLGKYAGNDVEVDGESYTLVSESEILTVVELA